MLRRGAIIFPFLGAQWIVRAQEKGALTKEKKLNYKILIVVPFFSSCADGALRGALIYHLFLAPSSLIGRVQDGARRRTYYKETTIIEL
jgi:hypothetical protein